MGDYKQWMILVEAEVDSRPLHKMGDWVYSDIARDVGRIQHHEQNDDGNFYSVQWHNGTITQDIPEITLKHAAAPPTETETQTPFAPPAPRPKLSIEPMMLVGDVIKGRNPITIAASMSVAAAAKLIAQYNIGALPVMANDDLVGIVSERDIASKIVATGISSETSVASIMTPHPVTLSSLDSLTSALETMHNSNIRHLPITSNGKIIGILSMKDAIAGITHHQR